MDTVLELPTDFLLEQLGPLSPELFSEKEIADFELECSSKNITKDEKEGELLEELVALAENEPAFLDWCCQEKAPEFPFFNESESNCFPSATDSYSVKANGVFFPSQYPGQTIVNNNSNINNNNNYQQVQTSALQFNLNNYQYKQNQDVSLLPATLTPPASPKDEDLLKLLQAFKPDELEKIVQVQEGSKIIDNDVGSSIYDDSSDCVLSPFMSSDSGIDEHEWNANNYGPVKTHNSKRTKPYSRVGSEDRKLRKKEQNKNAATRYRMKKKAEIEEIVSEEKDVEMRNKELNDQLAEVTREVKYLKSLMRDLYKAKGIIQ